MKIRDKVLLLKKNLRSGQNTLNCPILCCLFIICLFLICSCDEKKAASLVIYHQDWIDFNKNGYLDTYENRQATLEDRIEDLLSQMTLEEKTCQMATLYGYGRVAKDELPTPGWSQAVWKNGIGNIDEASNGVYAPAEYKYPYHKHVWALNEIQKFFVEKTRLGIPVEFTNEGIRGLNHFLSTSFPASTGMGATWNQELIYKMARCVGREGYALGYHNIYAPVLDVARDQRWGRIVESFGEDPFLVSQCGIQVVKGLQQEGVSSTLKHFALYSAPKGGRDGHVRLDPHISLREAHQVYLYPFKQAIRKAGARGVMSSYNDYDGVPVTGSKYFLTKLLREDYGFKGYVVSDSDAVSWLFTKHRVASSYKEAVRQSVEAGLNIRTTFNPPGNFIYPLRELVSEGKISQETIDSRVRDILRVKFKEGIFDAPYRDPDKAAQVLRNPNHLELSLRAAQESIVLLKNKKNVLPLDISKIKRILVCGPNAKAEKSSISRYGSLGLDVVSVWEGVEKFLKDKKKIRLDYALGCALHDANWPKSEILPEPINKKEQDLINQAVRKAKLSDVIIAVMGEDQNMVGENLSRSSLNLPGHQIKLLQALKSTGKPVILLLIHGRPLSINYSKNELDAILSAGFPGEFGGKAVAEVLFGKYNPAGRLPFTWLRSVGQIPMNFPHKPYSQAGQAKSGPHGMGESRIVEPLYPFGYGLSYTDFAYSDLKIDNLLNSNLRHLQVSCKVKNVGKHAGDEVLQLYIKDEFSSVTTYDWQLRGFSRIHLAVGEQKEVTFTVNYEDLAIINGEGNEVVEPGKFKLAIGSSSTNFKLTQSFSLK